MLKISEDFIEKYYLRNKEKIDEAKKQEAKKQEDEKRITRKENEK